MKTNPEPYDRTKFAKIIEKANLPFHDQKKCPKISQKELAERFDRIVEYGNHFEKAEMPHHCTTRRELEAALRQWGYPLELAKLVTKEPNPSAILAKTAATQPTTSAANVL